MFFIELKICGPTSSGSEVCDNVFFFENNNLTENWIEVYYFSGLVLVYLRKPDLFLTLDNMI